MAETPPPPEERPALKGVARSREEAKAWFVEHDYELGDHDLRLFTDELVVDGFRLARVWHTSATLRTVRRRAGILALIQLDGAATLTLGDGPATIIEPGDIAIVPSGTAFTTASTAPVARMEVETTGASLPEAVVAELIGGALLRSGTTAFGSTLTASINAALNADVRAGSPGFLPFRVGLDHLLVATILSGVSPAHSQRTSRPAHLFVRAQELITLHAAEPTFDVHALARELRISEQYLRSVFAARGTTVRTELRSARTQLARRLYPADPLQRSLSAAAAARLAGFRGPQAMRAALRRGDDGAATVERGDGPEGAGRGRGSGGATRHGVSRSL